MVKKSRDADLRKILENKRKTLTQEIQGGISGVRSTEPVKFSQSDPSTAGSDNEVELALLQMKSETLLKLKAALRRLEEGSYGDCFECGDEIPGTRLEALPFAVRCRDCEETREMEEQRARRSATEQPWST